MEFLSSYSCFQVGNEISKLIFVSSLIVFPSWFSFQVNFYHLWWFLRILLLRSKYFNILFFSICQSRKNNSQEFLPNIIIEKGLIHAHSCLFLYNFESLWIANSRPVIKNWFSCTAGDWGPSGFTKSSKSRVWSKFHVNFQF